MFSNKRHEEQLTACPDNFTLVALGFRDWMALQLNSEHDTDRFMCLTEGCLASVSCSGFFSRRCCVSSRKGGL